MNLKFILQIFGILAVIFSLFPFVAADYWWIRMFDFPHVQLTILTFVALMVYFFRFDLRNWRDYAFILILSACFLLQLTKIYSYTPLAEVQVKDNTQTNPLRSLSILASNVLQDNTEYHRVLDEVLTEDPDLLIFTETDKIWRDQLRTGLKDFGYTYKLEMPLDNTYGMLLYSKLELIDPRVRFLLDDSIPSMHSQLLMPSGEKIELHILHPTPPMPPHDMSSTDRDAQMMMVAKMAKKSELPVIVAGDFNDVAWSESTSVFLKVSELLDPRIGRGFYNTFNVESWFMRWPLDHLFVSDEFRVIDIHLGNDVESDHFPFYAKLSLEPEKAGDQKAPAPTQKEMEYADKQIKNEAEKNQKEKTADN